jgi:putative membrane protein
MPREPQPGREIRHPDPRFTLANERTFLAWTRTALAFVAAGLAVTQLLPDFATSAQRQILGLPLLAVGALIAVASVRRWQASEQAMRLGRPLPTSHLPRLVAVVTALAALVAAVLTLTD